MAENQFGQLGGRRAVVTGSTSGIGRAVAVEIARAGADVVVHGSRSAECAEALARQISESGGRAQVLIADFSHQDEVEQFAGRAWDCSGGIDVWIHCAGVDLLTGDAPGWDFHKKLQKLLDVDVAATVGICRQVGRRMAEAAGGVILTVGWDQAERGMEGDSGELFSTAKNAVMGFSRSLALSLAPDVRVNCIAPGWIRTAWGEQAGDYWQERVRRETPLGRWGTPEDVAKMARFLASDDASYITGQVINVNGGAVR